MIKLTLLSVTMKKIDSVIQRIKENSNSLLTNWVSALLKSPDLRQELISEKDLKNEAREFLELFSKAIESGELENLSSPIWEETIDFLKNLSRSRAEKGFNTTETALFIISLKHQIIKMFEKEFGDEGANLIEPILQIGRLIDRLGLKTVESYISSREEIIKRQQSELLELSTPVIRVWEGVLALPLIGTLDSARTQIAMENLLQEIVETAAETVIIDITGVPAVDTLVAQHLIKTVSAARLMGVDCIISGIRPQIAQTMVHLGVGFQDIKTKASLSEALREAFRLKGLRVVRSESK